MGVVTQLARIVQEGQYFSDVLHRNLVLIAAGLACLLGEEGHNPIPKPLLPKI